MRISVPFPNTGDRPGIQKASRRRRWLLIPVLLLIAAGAGFWWLSSRRTTTTTTTSATVKQDTIVAMVSGSGSVAAARTVDLSFQQAGTITAVNVKVGDQVKAGQALATIDAGDLQLALEQAQANLKAAQANYDQTANGSATAQDLASAQASLDSAKAQLQQTRTGTATAADIQSAQAQLDAAKAKLDALKNPSTANLSSAQSKVDQAQTALHSTQNSASQAKTNTQLQMQNAVNALTQAQSKFSTAQQNWQHVQDTGTDPTNPTTTDASGTKKANKLNNAQRQQYYDAFVSAQASLDSAQNAVTQAQVAYDTARQSEVTQIAQAEASLKDAQQTLEALKNPSASDLTQAQAAVTQAQASLTKLKQGGTPAAITQSQASVTQAQANLDKLTAPASDADIAAAQANVLQAQANVDTAQRNLDQATLTAPFDGVVSAVGLQVGSSSSSSSNSTTSTSSSGITLVDRSKLHIDVSLSETDAAKVQVGQPVSLTFDALPNVTLNGTIATVSPSATTSQNVVTYPIQIEFDPGQTSVKVGMSATADIQVQKVDNAILVPSRAVQTSGSTKTVTVLQGAQRTAIAVPVTTGLTSNGQTEITSSGGNGVPALKAGDLVSVPSTTTTTSTSTQNNRGGFGGPPPGL
jgi:HlyD family secretion protein